MKYIDAEKLIAEIERRLERYDPNYTSAGFEFKELLSFIDSLQQEQPEGNLEKEIQRYLCEECSSDDEPTITEIATHFYELGKLNAKEK